jgi:hypothetical protein
MIRSCIEEGKLQVTAAAGLLQHSRLVQWNRTKVEFAGVDWQEFDTYWVEIDRYFGRFICWITFSAGAELLVKGVCLRHGVDIREFPPAPEAPRFGVLGDLWRKRKGKNTHLDCLFQRVQAETKDQKFVLDTYKLLAKNIRNRDVHAYVPNVRNNDFNLVSDRFVPCFNLMMSWLPDGSVMSDVELETFFSLT